jgi:hypothetical protein
MSSFGVSEHHPKNPENVFVWDYNRILLDGWATPLKNSWDDDIPNIWKNIIQMFQTTNQYILDIVIL